MKLSRSKVTKDMKQWLWSMGGRIEDDVEKDIHGMFVLMYDPHSFAKMEKVYLPYQPRRFREGL